MTSGYARPEAPGKAFAYNDYSIQLYQKTLFERVFKQPAEKVVKDPNRLGPLQFQDPLIFMQGTNRLAANVALLVSSVLDKKVKPAQKEARRLNVQRWHPHDFAFKSSKRYSNLFLVPFSATLTSPKGKTYTLGGFYDGRGTWKVRVRPDIKGE
jgi:hypothetical protein